MPTRRATARLFAFALATWARCESNARAFAPPRPTPSPPSKSLGAVRVGRSFPATGIRRVIVRAARADGAEVVAVPGARLVSISGLPSGGAEGYHPADPHWRETPASAWGLDFAARIHGTTLVISSVREMSYIHHQYQIEQIRIEVPEGVEVVKEPRTLSGRENTLPTDLGPPHAG